MRGESSKHVLVSRAVSAFSWTSIAKMKVSQHPVSLIQCGPSSQFVFELVSRDCQPPLPFLLSIILSTSLYMTLLLYHTDRLRLRAHPAPRGRVIECCAPVRRCLNPSLHHGLVQCVHKKWRRRRSKTRLGKRSSFLCLVNLSSRTFAHLGKFFLVARC